MHSRPQSAPQHDALYRTAEAQAGYFATRQAAIAGFTRPLLAHHARNGQFQRVRHGVYRLTRFPDMPHADLFIAHLEVGPRSVVSHESALALYELTDVLPSAIHLTVPRTSSRRHSGLRLHTRRLNPDEVTQRHGLPVTTVLRTLTDIASGHRPNELVRQAVHEALQRGLVTRSVLSAYAAKRRGAFARLIAEMLPTKKVS